MPNKKLLYIAAPFFTEEQVKQVTWVENLIAGIDGLACYSPRKDGVLLSMTPEERKANAPTVFKRNCVSINNSDALLAILNEKDSGTTWELGYAYYHRRYFNNTKYRIFGWTDQVMTMNVMIRQGLDALVHGPEDLATLLTNYASDKAYSRLQPSAEVK